MELNKVTTDIAIVGAGPGGYVAAIKAAQAGLSVSIIEAEHMGGICLNWGCIPTKTLLKSAEMYMKVKDVQHLGIQVENVGFNLDKIVERSRMISNKLSSGIAQLMKKNNITVINGFAVLKDETTLTVSDAKGTITEVSANNIILATGAKPRDIEGFQSDGERVWNYKHALVPRVLPDSLVIIGSGAIGIEFANFYHALGVDVHVVEIMDSILPAEDHEISAFAQRSMAKRGMKFHTKTKVKSLERLADKVIVTLDKSGKESTLEVTHVITAMGVVPNVTNIGLENVGVSLNEIGFIKTNGFCQTTVPSIYAIGDVAGAPCLAHKASHEGIICIDAIIDQSKAHLLNKKQIPACTYGFPQIASLGYKELEAKKKFVNIKIGKFPFQANGKALAIDEAEGFIKVIFNDDTGELIGAHMIGAEVTELIQGFSIAQMLEATEQEISQTIFPHPTLSEMMHEAVLDAYNKAIHI